MAGKNSVCDIPADFKPILPPRKRARTQEEKEQRRIERILRNRRAAHQSREKKRLHLQHLEEKCHLLERILKTVDIEKLSLKDAKLGGMVNRWKELDCQTQSYNAAAKQEMDSAMRSPESLTSSSPEHKENLLSCTTNSLDVSAGSVLSSGPVSTEEMSSTSPFVLPFEENGCSVLDEAENSSISNSGNADILGQNYYHFASTPFVKVEDDYSVFVGGELNGNQHIAEESLIDTNPVVLFDNHNTTTTNNNNINKNVASETNEGWNLLLTSSPELKPELADSESFDLVDPIGLDTWRNPAVIVT